jgi:hypothetical protein
MGVRVRRVADPTELVRSLRQEAVAFYTLFCLQLPKIRLFQGIVRTQSGPKRVATQFSSPQGPAVAALERPICLLVTWGLPGSTGSARDSCQGLLLTRNAHVQLARTGRCPSDNPHG